MPFRSCGGAGVRASCTGHRTRAVKSQEKREIENKRHTEKLEKGKIITALFLPFSLCISQLQISFFVPQLALHKYVIFNRVQQLLLDEMLLGINHRVATTPALTSPPPPSAPAPATAVVLISCCSLAFPFPIAFLLHCQLLIDSPHRREDRVSFFLSCTQRHFLERETRKKIRKKHFIKKVDLYFLDHGKLIYVINLTFNRFGFIIPACY